MTKTPHLNNSSFEVSTSGSIVTQEFTKKQFSTSNVNSNTTYPDSEIYPNPQPSTHRGKYLLGILKQNTHAVDFNIYQSQIS